MHLIVKRPAHFRDVKHDVWCVLTDCSHTQNLVHWAFFHDALRVNHEFTKYIIRTLFDVNTVYARFDYETAQPLNDLNTTLIQAYYALRP